MKSRLFATFGVLLVILASSACDSTGNEQNSKGSETDKKNQDKLCYQTAAYMPNPKHIERYDPTPEAFKGATAGKARPYQEVYDGLLKFNTKLNAVYDIDAYTVLDPSKVDSEITQYLRDELYGKHISGWQGWVVQTGARAIEYAPHTIDAPQDDSKAVLLYMSDPFTSTVPSPVMDKNGFELPQLTGLYVIVANATEASGQQICLGQKVSIDGDVTWSPTLSFVSPKITLPTATLAIQEDKIADRTTPPTMKDVVINVKGISGWGGGIVYEMTLYGDGTLLYFGTWFVKVKEYRITNIGEASVQQILAAFDKAGFDSMKDYSDGCCDFGSEYITLTRGNSTKQVAHNGGNTSAPKELSDLEYQIGQLTHTTNWIH